MLGILVVQDLALGLMLAVLPALNQPTELIAVPGTPAWVIHCRGCCSWDLDYPIFLRLLARTESRELFIRGGSSVSGHCAAHRAFRAFN